MSSPWQEILCEFKKDEKKIIIHNMPHVSLKDLLNIRSSYHINNKTKKAFISVDNDENYPVIDDDVLSFFNAIYPDLPKPKQNEIQGLFTKQFPPSF